MLWQLDSGFRPKWSDYVKMIVTLLLTFVAPVSGAEEIVDLWESPAPYSKPNSLEEYIEVSSYGVPCAYNVTRATLTVHPAQGENSGKAMIILPGGGYTEESIVAEGQEIAVALSAQGITAAVLKYRLPLPEASDRPHLLPLIDARRAISLMKSMADTYGFDRSKVGIMGFSAGGHLATAAGVLRSENPDEIPDFSALVYPVTTMAAENQKWLEETLFHRSMTAEEKRQYSLVDNVTAATPPTFLIHAFDDDDVPISESIVFAEALAAVGQDVEVHLFAKGGHGFGGWDRPMVGAPG
jgi:acetyl esterase/lipase